MSKRIRKSRETSNTYNLNSEVDSPHWRKTSSIEEEEIGKNKCRKRSGNDIINKALKVSSSEEEEIGIRKCRRISRVDIINEEVKGWTSSSKKNKLLHNQEIPRRRFVYNIRKES